LSISNKSDLVLSVIQSDPKQWDNKTKVKWSNRTKNNVGQNWQIDSNFVIYIEYNNKKFYLKQSHDNDNLYELTENINESHNCYFINKCIMDKFDDELYRNNYDKSF
jgi:hypothetical protein